MGWSPHASALPVLSFPILVALSVGCANTQQTTAPEPVASSSSLEGERIQKAVESAWAEHRDDKSGKNADYIPYLANVPSELFGIAVVTVDGEVFAAGDADYAFSIQSVSKPFTALLVMQESGSEAITEKIGVEPTGLPFNSIVAVETLEARSVNPLVNAGAMAAVSLVGARDAEAKWQKIRSFFNDLAGEEIAFNDEVYESESATNRRNRAIATLLSNYERLYDEPFETCDVYTKQCSLNVTSKQLAVMGATLANGGVNPITNTRVVDRKHVPRILSVMMMAGFYDEAGIWAWNAGVPAKTGVGGGIVAVVPGKLAIVGFSPRLSPSGNSIRASKAIGSIVNDLELNLFGSFK